MIRFEKGNILDADVEAVVNTVNCVGIMGRGVALQFKKAYPENFRAYADACRGKEVRPGHMFVFETGQCVNPRYIVNFPTKRHWRSKSRIEDIEAGLDDLASVIRERGIRSIAVPPLGSGLGGLEWDDVRPRIEAMFEGFDTLDAIVFEPGPPPPADQMARTRVPPTMTPGRASLVGLMDLYLKGLFEPVVRLLEVHKLLYFMQIAGQPLNLRYAEGLYGPFAENLNRVLHEIEGYFVSGYADGGDEPYKPLKLVPGAIEEATEVLRNAPEDRERFERVADLVEGFESPFGLELLSTVHWILVRDRPATRDDLVERVHGWNERKKRFTVRQIGLAADVLTEKGWIAHTIRVPG